MAITNQNLSQHRSDLRVLASRVMQRLASGISSRHAPEAPPPNALFSHKLLHLLQFLKMPQALTRNPKPKAQADVTGQPEIQTPKPEARNLQPCKSKTPETQTKPEILNPKLESILPEPSHGRREQAKRCCLCGTLQSLALQNLRGIALNFSYLCYLERSSGCKGIRGDL